MRGQEWLKEEREIEVVTECNHKQVNCCCELLWQELTDNCLYQIQRGHLIAQWSMLQQSQHPQAFAALNSNCHPQRPDDSTQTLDMLMAIIHLITQIGQLITQ